MCDFDEWLKQYGHPKWCPTIGRVSPGRGVNFYTEGVVRAAFAHQPTTLADTDEFGLPPVDPELESTVDRLVNESASPTTPADNPPDTVLVTKDDLQLLLDSCGFDSHAWYKEAWKRCNALLRVQDVVEGGS